MAPRPVDSAKTFISYAREDADFALQLARELRQAGANIWVDQLDIAGGQRWDHAVQEALDGCSRLIVILSPASIAKDNVLDEARYALDQHKQVIPVLYQECRIPYWLHRLQRVDVRNGITDLLHVLGAPQPAGAVRVELPAETLEPELVESQPLRCAQPASSESTAAPLQTTPPVPQPDKDRNPARTGVIVPPGSVKAYDSQRAGNRSQGWNRLYVAIFALFFLGGKGLLGLPYPGWETTWGKIETLVFLALILTGLTGVYKIITGR